VGSTKRSIGLSWTCL